LKTASVRGRRKLSAAEKEALVEDGPRRRGVRPPGAREVWGNPVAWRETVTRAHGFITTVAGRVYIAAMVLLAVVLLFLERLDIDGEAWWAAAMMGYAFTGVLAVLVATSSMVAEQRRGTLALLCVTPLGGGRIVLGKLLGLGVYLTPPFVMASVCALLGSSHSLSRFRWWNQVPDTSLLVTRTGFAMWLGFAAALFLGSASLWLAARMRTPTRAWMATVGFACAVAIVPGIALGLARGQGWVSEVVAWINPVLSESFWEDDLPHRVIPSGVAWVSLSLALLAHNARTLGRVAR
ncbi:MAG: ABC transporter permease, partial [Deltaproteobacteria bacterium]|nr:ABC transporter permease [Deltaproteobacteria bacterium]